MLQLFAARRAVCQVAHGEDCAIRSIVKTYSYFGTRPAVLYGVVGQIHDESAHKLCVAVYDYIFACVELYCKTVSFGTQGHVFCQGCSESGHAS